MQLNKEGKSTFIYILLAITWTFITIYASTMSSSNVNSIRLIHFEGIDKVAHLVLYACFSFFWYTVFTVYNRAKAKWMAFIFGVLFGIAMEYVQYYFFIDRFFEVSDIIANIIGSFIGVTLLNRIKLFKLC